MADQNPAQGFDINAARQSGMDENQIYDHLQKNTPGFDFAAAERMPGATRSNIIDYLAKNPKRSEIRDPQASHQVQTPQSFVPSAQPSENFPQGHLTREDMYAAGANMMPMIGGAVGALGAGIPGSALGGATGETARQLLVSNVGPEKFHGPTFQSKVPGTASESAQGILAEGGFQGLNEVGGELTAKLMRGLLGGARSVEGRAAENAAIKELNDRYDLKLTALEVRGRHSTIQELGGLGIMSQARIRSKWGESVANGLKSINEIVGRLYPSTSPTAAGKDVQGILSLSSDVFHDQAGVMYSALDQEAKGVGVGWVRVGKWAQDKLDEIEVDKNFFKRTGGPGQKAIDILKDLVGAGFDAEGKPREVPFRVADRERSRLRKVGPQMDELFANEAGGTAKKAVQDITQAMDDSAAQLNPKAQQLWKDARAFYAEGAQLFDNEAIQSLMKKEPESVVKAVKPGQVDMVSRIRRAILDYPTKYGDPSQAQDAELTWRKFQEQFIRTNLMEDPENAGKGFTVERLANLKTKIEEYGPGVMDEMFGNSQTGKAARKHLEDIGEAFSRVQKLPVKERIGAFRALEVLGTLASGQVVSGSAHIAPMAMTLGSLEAVPMLIQGVIYNKAATRYFLEGFGGLVRFASENAGKKLIRIQEKTVTSPKSYDALGSAMANILRAYEVVQSDRSQMEESFRKRHEDDPYHVRQNLREEIDRAVPPGAEPDPSEIRKQLQ